MDGKKDDFRLQAPPALNLGFEAIPVEKIGVREK
jgi:hypothetical protein